jgi:proteasome accessory factor C
VRTVRPFTFAQQLGHWYLFGHDSERGRALPFRVDRIAECTLTEERFDPPAEADLARARLFSEASGEPIRIQLGPVAAAWAMSRPGVEIVKRTGRGGAVVELAGVSPEWATRFALSFAGDARVLGPAPARRHFDETVRRGLARYA